MLAFVYALVITAGLGAILAAVCFVRYAFIRSRRPVWISAVMGVSAFAALAGAVKFCYDLVAYRKLWTDDSAVIAILNLVGVLMDNAYALLLIVSGCALIYFLPKSADRQETDDKSVER